MTKISFDVDFSEDPEKILQQIQDRAKAEVEKRETKERVSGYLSKLHEKVNEDINTEYKSATDLIKALTPFASPALKDKLSSTSPSGRRKTVSMSKDVYASTCGANYWMTSFISSDQTIFGIRWYHICMIWASFGIQRVMICIIWNHSGIICMDFCDLCIVDVFGNFCFNLPFLRL